MTMRLPRYTSGGDPRVVDFDSGIGDRTDGGGRASRCSRGKSTCTLRHSAWKPAKWVVIVWKRFRSVPIIESFLQAEVAQVVGAEFVAQVAGESLRKALFQ